MNIGRYLFSLFFISVIANSLSAAVVTGRIVDADDAPLEFVNVSIRLKKDKSKVYGAITNEHGNFKINGVPTGNYQLEASFIGYLTATKDLSISPKAETVRAGIIILKEDSKLLSEVEVVGQASQMRFDIDKKVFNVDQNLASSGASASEMLESIPSVDVDNDGNVALRNNSNVEVWINGKPSGLNEDNRAQILEQMPAGSIEAVEVITNPSAKYNPEGTAGIINLILKKDRKPGYYGSVSAGGVYNIGSPAPGANLGFNFNYNSKIVDLYINLGSRYNNSSTHNYTDRLTFNKHDGITDTISHLYNGVSGKRMFLGFFGSAGADFHINKKNTIGISFMGHGGMNHSNNLNEYTQINFLTNDTLLYNRDRWQKAKFPSYTVGLNYLYEIDTKGSEIRSSIEYSGHSRGGDYHYEQRPIKGASSEYTQIQRMDGRNDGAIFRLDYTQMFAKTMKLEAGLYGSWHKRFSPSRTWNLQPEGDSLLVQYNDFGYEEWIAAAYATYGAKFGPFSFSVGLRGEYTHTDVDTRESADVPFDNTPTDYWQIYPTAFLSYMFPKSNELQINYTRRIDRPRGRTINAFRNMSDSTNISFGNPLLRPEISSSLELNYLKTWTNHALSASLYYYYTGQSISRVRFLDDNNIMNSTYENIAKEQSAGLEVVAKNKVAKWLNLTTTVNLYYFQMDSVFYDSDHDGMMELLYPSQQNFSWDARLMANFLIPLGFSAQLTGKYTSPRLLAQGKSRAQYTIDLGIKKSFLKKTLVLSLSVRDLLNSKRWANSTWGENFYQYSSYEPRGTKFNLTLTYNFGEMFGKRRPKSKYGEGGYMMEYESEDMY